MHFIRAKVHPVTQILILLMCLAVPVIKSETCEMILQIDRKAPDSPFILGQKSQEECNDECLALDQCVGAYLQHFFCIYFTDRDAVQDSPGYSFYEKICSEAPTTTEAPSSCTMDQSNNKDAPNPSLTLSFETTSCQDACQALVDCSYCVFEDATDICQLYMTSSVTTVSQGGFSTSKRIGCTGSGKSCCFETTSGQSITEPPALTFTFSQVSCEELCLAVSSCQAVVYTGTSCKMYTSTPSTTSLPGVVFASKTCPQSASTGSLTFTDTCESTASAIPSVALTTLLLLVGIHILI